MSRSAIIAQHLRSYHCNVLRDNVIEKELDQALVRAKRLRQSVLKSALEGRLV